MSQVSQVVSSEGRVVSHDESGGKPSGLALGCPFEVQVLVQDMCRHHRLGHPQ
jgi:hypothetical protein